MKEKNAIEITLLWVIVVVVFIIAIIGTLITIFSGDDSQNTSQTNEVPSPQVVETNTYTQVPENTSTDITSNNIDNTIADPSYTTNNSIDPNNTNQSTNVTNNAVDTTNPNQSSYNTNNTINPNNYPVNNNIQNNESNYNTISENNTPTGDNNTSIPNGNTISNNTPPSENISYKGYSFRAGYLKDIPSDKLLINTFSGLNNFCSRFSIQNLAARYNEVFFQTHSLAMKYIALTNTSDSINFVSATKNGNSVKIEYKINNNGPQGDVYVNGGLVIVEVDKTITNVE